MKPSATGRILFWRGGSLWIGRGGEPTGIHAHHAVQISLPFPPAQVRFQVPFGKWKNFGAAIIAAERPHALDARDHFVSQIFVEPESRDGRGLQERYRNRGVSALDTASLKHEVTALATAYKRRDSDDTLIALARAAVSRLADSSPAPKISGDPRVTQAIEVIRERLGGPIALAAIAAAVHLSPDRFRHLFLEETGVGLRPYVLWLRLELSLGSYVAGSTLTDAAYAGGFADGAHFSRTFKRMFGIAPASVRPE
jgi:AraC family transcriptional regulator